MSDPNSAPTGYDEIIQVLERLPFLIQEKRRRERLSLREAARQMDMSFATVSRCEAGQDMNLGNALKALRWVSAS